MSEKPASYADASDAMRRYARETISPRYGVNPSPQYKGGKESMGILLETQ
jgi:hypothetical protein